MKAYEIRSAKKKKNNGERSHHVFSCTFNYLPTACFTINHQDTPASFPQDTKRYQAVAKSIIQVSSHDESQVHDQFFSNRVSPRRGTKMVNIA